MCIVYIVLHIQLCAKLYTLRSQETLLSVCIHIHHHSPFSPSPPPPDARASLVPTFVAQTVSHMDQQMPRTNYKAEERSNTDCMTCIGRLVEYLAEKELGVTDDDIDHLTALILPHMRLHKLLPQGNPLSVRIKALSLSLSLPLSLSLAMVWCSKHMYWYST